MRFSPAGRPSGGEDLRLQPGQQPQRLGVALEAADAVRHLVEGRFAVVAERRVAEVVAEAGGVHDVGVAAQRAAQFAAHLGDLEAVGEPGADEVVGVRGHHLGLRAEPAQRRGVQDPGAVALEVRAVGALGRLLDPAGGVAGGVAVQDGRGGPGFSHRTRPVRRRRSRASGRRPACRFSSQSLGSAGFLGEPARPRGPSASPPGYGESRSSWSRVPRSTSRLVTSGQLGPQFAADHVALEVPGHVLADFAQGLALVRRRSRP